MSRLLIAFALLLLFSLPCLAYKPDPWTKTDTTIETAFIAFTIYDICQTNADVQSGLCYECNPVVVPLVGKYPSTENLVALGICWPIAHATIAKMLPKKVRHFWQAFTFAWTFYDVAHTYKTSFFIQF